MKDLSSLKKKLAAYSALTAGVIALASEKSAGQIIYTDIIPDLNILIGDTSIDLNNDGIADFKFEKSIEFNSYSAGFSTSGELLVSPYGDNQIIGTGAKAYALSYGNLITKNSRLPGVALMVSSWSTFQCATSDCYVYFNVQHYTGNWHNTVDHYLGFSLVVNADTLYGWMRLDVSLVDGAVTLKDYAYNSSPGKSVAAGDTINVCTQQPVIIPDVSSCDSALFSVNEIPGVQFQWFHDSNPIPGATDFTYTASSSGSYSVKLLSDSCNAISQPVSIIIFPTINPPINRNADTLYSDSYYSYQWYLNGSPIPGATDSSYVITGDGVYGLIASNANGCNSNFTFSDETICSELLDPHIIPSAPGVICSGLPVQLYQMPYSDGTYQWYFNDSLINGAVSSNYFAASAGSYFITVKNFIGCMESSNTIVVVADNNPVIAIITRVQDTLQSTSNFSYQWGYNETPINGAISQFYEMAQSGSYQVIVGDSLGCTAVSDPYFALTCNLLAFADIAGAATQEICFEDSLTLLTPHVDSTYQWFMNGNSIPGAVQQSIVVDTGGVYSLVVSAAYGCVDTSFVTIIQPVIPFITLLSDSVLFSSSFVNNQWYFNGTPIAGATGSTYIPQVAGTYQVLVTDAYGCTSLSPPYDFFPTSIKDAVGADLFNAFVENKQLIIQLHQSPLPSRMILFNAIGVKLSEHTITQSELVMDVSRLSSGIYFVVVVGADGKQRVKKVVIE